MGKLFLEISDKTRANGNPSWAVDVWKNREQQPTQYLCLSALAAAFFGRVNKDPNNLDYGSKMYCHALSSLVNDLNNHGQAALVPHLLSSLCLGIYELVTSSHLRGWLQHCSGMSAIVRNSPHLGPVKSSQKLSSRPRRLGLLHTKMKRPILFSA